MKNLSIQIKLLLIVFSAIIVVTMSLTMKSVSTIKKMSNENIQRYEKQVFDAKKESLKNYVQMAQGVLETYRAKVKPHTTQNQLVQIKKDALIAMDSMTYGEDGYVFVWDYDGVPLAFILRPDLIGKPLLNLKGGDGKDVIKDHIKNAKKGGGHFYTYKWRTTKGSPYQTKISYSFGLQDWRWFVGTGEYMAKEEAQIKAHKEILFENTNELIRAIIMNALSIIIVIGIVFYFLVQRLINKPIKRLENGLNNFFLFLQNKTTTVDLIKITSNDEFGKMAKYINENIKVSTRLHKEIKELNTNLEDKINDRTKELQEQKETFEAIFSDSKDAIAIIDMESNFLEVNPAYIEMTGFTKEELLNASCLSLTVSQDIESAQEAIKRVLEFGYVKNFEIDSTIKDGTIITINMSMSIMSGNEKILISARDISKNKELERHLIEAKQKAEEAAKTKSEFLANMSHEIRTPMNGIIGMSHLALQTHLNDKQKNYVQKIDNSAKSLLGIINDILDFSKIEAGKLTIENIEFDLFKTIDGIIHLIEFKAHEKNLELIVSYGVDVGNHFYGDSLRVSQILTNLMGNALKFTSSGEIGIYITKIRDNRLRFEVKDTGIGLTLEQQNKLFQSFSQADGSTTRKYGGTGLGLTISKQLVELMGGKIWVESQIDVGSSFIFEIELKALKGKNTIKNRFKDKRVLIVDDNDTWQEILANVLQSFGLQFDIAHSGTNALKILQECKNKFDLILMDWNMPGLDGIATTKLIKETCVIEKTPTVIMVSAFRQESIINAAKDVGIDIFLQKPINPSTLNDIFCEIFLDEIKIHYSTQKAQESLINEIYTLSGSKILLADDNTINQEIVLGLLEDSGIEIDIANNGSEAVDKFKTNQYELILMDLQMPIMDGLSATKIIRQLNKEIPIIALTANAMRQDVEETQMAGMNEHLNKPIEIEKLYKTLLKYISPKCVKHKKLLPEREEIYVPEFTNIYKDIGLSHLAHNKKLYLKILNGFIKDYKDKSLDNLEDNEFKRTTHTLKGLSANIGATNLHHVAKELDETRNKELLPQLYKELNLVISELEEKLLRPECKETKGKKAISPEIRDDLFTRLKQAVATKRPKKCEPVIQEIEGYNLLNEDREVFDQVKFLINKYKFKEVENLLN